MSTLRWLLFIAALAMTTSNPARAQEAETGLGPQKTSAGMLAFIPQNPGFSAQLDGKLFDQLDGTRIAHFDETSGARMIVESFDGKGPPLLALYDFRRQPPSVERIGRRMKLDGVFWQGDEVVLKTTAGWFRWQRGTLTKLVSSKTIYH
jgi:hypothetical protein